MTLWRHKSLINMHELFENCSERRLKLPGQIQIAISQELTGILACSFLWYDPWNNVVKAIIKEQKYNFLSFELLI